MKTTITSLLLLFFSFNNAQFLEKLAKKAQKSTERAIERKIEEKATKTTNDGMDVILSNKNSKQKMVLNQTILQVIKAPTKIQILLQERKLFLKKNLIKMLKESSL